MLSAIFTPTPPRSLIDSIYCAILSLTLLCQMCYILLKLGSALFFSRATCSCSVVGFYKNWNNIIIFPECWRNHLLLNRCKTSVILAACWMNNCDTGGHKCSQKLSLKKKETPPVKLWFRLSGPSKFYTFPSRARILIRPALQTALLPAGVASGAWGPVAAPWHGSCDG